MATGFIQLNENDTKELFTGVKRYLVSGRNIMSLIIRLLLHMNQVEARVF